MNNTPISENAVTAAMYLLNVNQVVFQGIAADTTPSTKLSVNGKGDSFPSNWGKQEQSIVLPTDVTAACTQQGQNSIIIW